MEQTSGIKTWQWVVTVIVVIVLIIIGYYMFSGSTTPAVAPAVVEETTTSTEPSNVNRINVLDQYPGQIVYISSVQLAQGGYVVIHKDNAGTPGAVIGYKYFDKGTYPGQITLTSPTVDGGIYYAMLHSDNGDKKFDAAKDLPIKDASGNIIMKLFHATNSVVESKG